MAKKKPTPPDTRLTQTVGIRVTSQEYDILERLAKEADRKLSDYLRRSIRQLLQSQELV